MKVNSLNWFIFLFLFLHPLAANSQIYITWQGLEPDKLASLWLIKRFVDQEAEFKLVPKGSLIKDGIPFDVLDSRDVPKLLAHDSIASLDELYVQLGEGRLHLKEVMGNIKDILFGGVSPLVTPTGAFNKIELTTLDPVSVKLSSCCKPNPTAKDNCALLTPKGLSVHHKNCERFRKLSFQREDAVNISWNKRETHVRKKQILHVLRASRKNIMQIIGSAPPELEMQSLDILSSYSSLYPAWELTFRVVNLYALQKVLKHFDKSDLSYEFDLDC